MKTQYSFSTDPTLKNAPVDHDIEIKSSGYQPEQGLSSRYLRYHDNARLRETSCGEYLFR